MSTESIQAISSQEELSGLSKIISTIKDQFVKIIQPLEEIRDLLKEIVNPEKLNEELSTWDSLLGILATVGTALGSVIAALLVAAGVISTLPADAVIAIGGAIGAIVVLLIAGIAKLVEIIAENWGSISCFFVDLWNNIYFGIVTFFTQTLPNFFANEIPKIIGNIVDFFVELPSKIWNAIISVKDTVFTWASSAVGWVSETVPNIIDTITGFFANVAEKIGESLGKFAGTIATWVVDAISWVQTEVPKIIDSIVGFFTSIPGRIGTALSNFKDTVVQWGKNCIEWVKTEVPKIINNIINFFAQLPGAIKKIGTNLIKGLWNGIVSAGTWLWDQIKRFFGGLWDAVSGFFVGFGQGFEEAYDPVPQFAAGGFPSMGQMFIARESGPELVGTIGGRTAVANNDQIVQGISSGVYRAMMAAGKSGGEQVFNIYLDGKQITASVEKHQRERGAAIMRGGVFVGA